MDVDSLRTLLAFVETGSLTRAAKQVYRTQAAVSMQMKKLEQELGVSLFDKQGRNLVLTREGQQLARNAARLVHLHDETKDLVAKSRGVVSIRIGCPDDYVDAILPRLIRFLKQTYNELDVQVVCRASITLRTLLDVGEIDFAIVSRAAGSDEGKLLIKSQGIWVGHPTTQISRQKHLSITSFERDCKFHQAAIEGLTQSGITFSVMASSQSLSAQLALIRAKLAIGAMAKLSCPSDLVDINSTELPGLPMVELAIICNQNTLRVFGADFVCHVVQEFNEVNVELE
ncbi:Transcriptional regulator [Pseudoalteromonas luteoviolacea B = ATCC 29581]|nr:Transcriptional regulator [Pseudoalteromonas luteoviolacea B = ATCC 29581]